MNLEDLLSRVALAFGIGLLIGLERGWHTRKARPGSRTAGVRTFAISGLLGGIVAAMSQDANGALTLAGSILLSAAFVAFAVAVTIFSRDENQAAHSFSATTAIAALLTFMLGAYSLLGDVRIASASAVATAGILIVREELHEWVAKITLAEFESGLILLAMTFIALPIVPDRPVGPFGGVNLHEIWIIAIVLASISFAGYVAVKLTGERRGILIAATAGGMVSSTAVALAYARRAAAGEGSPRLLAAGAALATAVSFIRVIAIVTVLNRSLAALVTLTLLTGAIVATVLAIAAVYWPFTANDEQAAVQFRNPFGFWSVVGMAASMGVLIIVGRLIQQKLGANAVIVGAGFMGLFDVDAMTIAMTRLASLHLQLQVAAYAILTGVLSNTLSKVAIGALIGRSWFSVLFAAMSLVCALAGGIVLFLTTM